MKLKKVLLTTDFSSRSKEAFQVAASQLEKEGEILLLYVVPQTHFVCEDPSLTSSPEVINFTEKELGRCEQKLAELVNKHFSKFNIKTLIVSPPHKGISEEIVRVAKDENCDAIIMSGTGKGFIDKLIIGSVSQKTIRLSDRPIMIVPSRAETS